MRKRELQISYGKRKGKTMSKSGIQFGKIIEFRGSWNSGIATLVIEHEDGTRVNVPCDNAPTVRALNAAYGNVIQHGHKASTKPFIDKWIYYAWDNMGLMLAGFEPQEIASESLVSAYEQQKGN